MLLPRSLQQTGKVRMDCGRPYFPTTIAISVEVAKLSVPLGFLTFLCHCRFPVGLWWVHEMQEGSLLDT